MEDDYFSDDESTLTYDSGADDSESGIAGAYDIGGGTLTTDPTVNTGTVTATQTSGTAATTGNTSSGFWGGLVSGLTGSTGTLATVGNNAIKGALGQSSPTATAPAAAGAAATAPAAAGAATAQTTTQKLTAWFKNLTVTDWFLIGGMAAILGLILRRK